MTGSNVQLINVCHFGALPVNNFGTNRSKDALLKYGSCGLYLPF